MTKDEIIHMSYGCSKDEGDILSWVAVRKKMKEKFQEEKSSICNEHSGELGSNFQFGVHLTVYMSHKISIHILLIAIRLI